MKKFRSPLAIGSSVERVNSYQFSARNISSQSVGASIDPILGIDHFEIRGPIFPPHPHAGFSPVTYLFEGGEGNFISRVSNGQTHDVQPGGVVWNISGSGLLHEEFPAVQGELSKGLQVLINLSADDKLRVPEVLSVDGPEVPQYFGKGFKVRVISGKFKDVLAKIDPPGNITFLDITIDQNAEVEFELPSDDNILAYVVTGALYTGDDDEKLLKQYDAVNFENNGKSLYFKAVEQDNQLIVIAAKALNEPIVKHGSVVGNSGGQTSFVMNTQEQIDDALKRFSKGEMGQLEPANDYSFLNKK